MHVIHEYKGFKYFQEIDEEPNECIKIFHEVLTPEGKTLHWDWSPYTEPTLADFQLWIDLECPGRVGCGPMRGEDLLKIKQYRDTIRLTQMI